MKQADIFRKSEGDAWHERNKNKPRLPDPVIEAMKACKIEPKKVLEIGCGTGWRLIEIEKLYDDVWCAGVDASLAAATRACVHSDVRHNDIMNEFEDIENDAFDLVIFGFCLYLVDREDLMMIAAHTDRVLKDGGHIIIHDFNDGTYRCPYKHKEGIWSYHMPYAHLWYNPIYQPAYEQIADESTSVIILKKDMVNAWPVRES